MGWIGARAEFVGPSAGVAVEAPGAVVVERPRAGVRVEGYIPAPSLNIQVGIGLPGVVVHERAPAVIVRERPVIIHERPVIIREHRGKHGDDDHDRGRHRGHR